MCKFHHTWSIISICSAPKEKSASHFETCLKFHTWVQRGHIWAFISIAMRCIDSVRKEIFETLNLTLNSTLEFQRRLIWVFIISIDSAAKEIFETWFKFQPRVLWKSSRQFGPIQPLCSLLNGSKNHCCWALNSTNNGEFFPNRVFQRYICHPALPFRA